MTDHKELIARLRLTMQQVNREAADALETLQSTVIRMHDSYDLLMNTTVELRAEVERKAQYGKEWMDKYLDLRERLTALESQEPKFWWDGDSRVEDSFSTEQTPMYRIPLFLAAGAAPKEQT